MFVGHYAVALAAKKVSPKTSLGTLFMAAQFVDLLWPLLLLLGVEHVRIDPGNTAFTPLDFYDYPISHSLAGAALWSAVFGLLYYVFRRSRRGAAVVALCVASHWVLDFLVHRADLPLAFGGEIRFGAGLWNSVSATIAVETLLFIAGIALYLSVTRPRNRAGIFGFWALVIVLYGIYIGNIVGPPPPDTGVLAVVGNASWLFVLWAFWVDRQRQPAAASGGTSL